MNTPTPLNMSRLPAVRKIGDEGEEPRAAGAFGDVDLTGQVVLGRYSIDKMIGGGAMGRVYKGRQLSIGRTVALKMVHPDSTWDREVARQRFHREATFLAGLQHPNVVNLVDYGITDDGHLVMVLEFLPGQTLKALIDEGGPLPYTRALELSRQLVRALRRIHRMGGIHRDVKPSNMMVQETEDGDDLLKLLDFGLIKVVEDAGKSSNEITGSTPALGTPLFISPEQALGESIDLRSDIYSAGAVMFNMVAGRPPFTGGSTPEVLTGHVRRPVPEIRSIAPDSDCHPALENVIRRCMEKLAEDRYPDTEALFKALSEVPGVPGASEIHTIGFEPSGSVPMVAPVPAEPEPSQSALPPLPPGVQPWVSSEPPTVAPLTPVPPRLPPPREPVPPPPSSVVGWASAEEAAASISDLHEPPAGVSTRAPLPRGETRLPTLPGPQLPSSHSQSAASLASVSSAESTGSSYSIPPLADSEPPAPRNRVRLWGGLMVLAAAIVALAATWLLNPP